MNTCDRGPECTVALPERNRHAGGTVGDRGARPGRIPATARAHNPARGLQQLQGPSAGPGARACSVRGRARGRPDGRRRRERARRRPNWCGRSSGGRRRRPGRHHWHLRTFITGVHGVSTCVGRRAGMVRGSERAPERSPRPSEASNRRGPRARPMGTRTPRATSVILVAWTPVLGPRESGSGSHTADQWFTPPAGHCNVTSAPDRRWQINTYVEEVLWPASVDSSSTNSPPAAAASHSRQTSIVGVPEEDEGSMAGLGGHVQVAVVIHDSGIVGSARFRSTSLSRPRALLPGSFERQCGRTGKPLAPS